MNVTLEESDLLVELTGMGVLLSTVFPDGLSDPFTTANGGWSTSSPASDPFSGLAAVGGGLDPFAGVPNVDPYTGAQATGESANAFTGGESIDPFTGLPDTLVLANSGRVLDTSQMLASNGPIPDMSQVGTSNDSPSSEAAPSGSRWVQMGVLAGQPVIDDVTIDGETYKHYQVNIDGVTYDAYANDTLLHGLALLVPSSSQAAAGDPSAGANAPRTTSELPAAGGAQSAPTAPPESGPTAPQAGEPAPSGPSGPTQGASDPLSPLLSAIPGGTGVGSQFAPKTNWTYRALAGSGPRGPGDPTLLQIRNGATLSPVQPQNGAPLQPEADPAEMTFRHTRGDNAVLTKGSDRISTARNLEPFARSGPGGLQTRGTGELARIDVDLATRLGGQFRDTAQLLDDLKSVERNLTQQLDAARKAGRGRTYILDRENKLAQVQRAQRYVQNYREGQFVNEIPSRAVSEVSGSRYGDPAAVADAAAREAAFLRGLEIFRHGGNALLILGILLSIDRVVTAPAGQVGRVALQEAGGWALSLAGAALGAKAGAALGGLLGIETGPGAVVTGAIGGLVGGISGFFGGEALADEAYDAGENLHFEPTQTGDIIPDEAYDPAGYFGVDVH